MLLGREASSFLIQKHLLNSLVDSKHNLPVLYINKPMSFHEICLLSSGPLCFLDCFFGLIPSERNVLIFKMLDSTFSLMITLPDQERPIMDTQNSVMRIYFDGVDAVDLLIFTSKQLHLDSLNTVTSPSTENFLWGIFRDKNHCRADMYDNGTTVDMEVDMAGGKMVGTVDVVVRKDSSTRCRRPDPIMKAVQQLLTIKEEHSSYLTRLRVLDCTIKQLLAFNSEEPIMKDEHSASSEMKTVCSMQVKLEKDEDETCLKTYKKTLPCLPCFPEPSPQSVAGSTDKMVGTTSTVDEVTIPRMLCSKDNHTTMKENTDTVRPHHFQRYTKFPRRVLFTRTRVMS